MAENNPPRTSERLWSEEVGMADAIDPLPLKEDGYEWSNGRKFKDGNGPYDVPQQ